jgi:hypothetical protein
MKINSESTEDVAFFCPTWSRMSKKPTLFHGTASDHSIVASTPYGMVELIAAAHRYADAGYPKPSPESKNWSEACNATLYF